MSGDFLKKIYEISDAHKSDIQKIVIKSERIVFYDTNSFAYHSRQYNSKNYALDFFKETDIVIFTDIVLNEIVSAREDIVNSRYLEYLDKINEKVKYIIILNHREFNLLYDGLFNAKHSENIIVNAFKYTFEGNIKVLNEIDEIEKKYKSDMLPHILNLYMQPEYKDNRGEISIFLSIMVLSKMKRRGLKFAIFSDDYKAYTYLSKLDNILEELNRSHLIGLCSTPKNIQIIFDELSLDKTRLTEYFNSIKFSTDANIYHRKAGYDSIVKEKFEISNLIESVYSKVIFIVY